MPLEDTGPELGLADLLQALRAEILEAEKRVRDLAQDPLFKLAGAEAEIQFLVEKKLEAGGGIHIHFFALQAKGSERHTNTHRLRVKLEPAGADIGVAGRGREMPPPVEGNE